MEYLVIVTVVMFASFCIGLAVFEVFPELGEKLNLNLFSAMCIGAITLAGIISLGYLLVAILISIGVL